MSKFDPFDKPEKKPKHGRADGRYVGLHKDPDVPKFSIFTPQTVVKVTIENTDYHNRPHRVIFWGEWKGEPRRLWHLLATDEDLIMIHQTFKNRFEEIVKNGNSKKTDS